MLLSFFTVFFYEPFLGRFLEHRYPKCFSRDPDFAFAYLLECQWSNPKRYGWNRPSLQWRHNERDGVSNHRRHHCLLNRLSMLWSKKKHQNSASLAFVRGIHQRPADSPHKWPVTRKMFPFDDVIMPPYHNQTKKKRGMCIIRLCIII